MSKVTEQDVLDVVRGALGPKGAKADMDSSAATIESWDSLGHLGILAALDQKFDGKIGEIDEMATADSVKKIIALLKDRKLL